MKKALTLTLLATAMALLLLPALAQAATTPTSTERRVISLVNQERAKRGLAPVKFKSSLTRAARAHSKEMARRGKLNHTSADGHSVARRVIRYAYKTRGYSYWSVGEVIARAQKGSLSATPTGVVAMWMNSTAHRRIILKRTFRDAGVGIHTAGDGMRYFTLDMGRRIR